MAKKIPKTSTKRKRSPSHDRKCPARKKVLRKEEMEEGEFRVFKQRIVEVVEQAPPNGLTLASIKKEVRKSLPEITEPDEYRSDHPLITRIPFVLDELKHNHEILLLDARYMHTKIMKPDNLLPSRQESQVRKMILSAKSSGITFAALKKTVKKDLELKTTLLKMLQDKEIVQHSPKIYSKLYMN